MIMLNFIGDLSYLSKNPILVLVTFEIFVFCYLGRIVQLKIWGSYPNWPQVFVKGKAMMPSDNAQIKATNAMLFQYEKKVSIFLGQ